MVDQYDDIRQIVSDLRSEGKVFAADKVYSGMKEGATGTQIFMMTVFFMKETLNKEEISENLRKKIRDAIIKMEILLK